jgi:hypothetical protein
MSLAITIVTTANRTRRFFQTDPARVTGILESLKRCNQLFTNSALVIVADDVTEVFNPRAIARIEIETQIDLTPWLPLAWDEAGISAIEANAMSGVGLLDDTGLSSRMDFYFEGGDTLAAWIERQHGGGVAERTSRLTHLFDKPCIAYRPESPGVGFVNPAAMTRFSLGVAAEHPPAGAWYASEA